MVGELLKGQRDDWVLATKLGNKMSERPNEGHYSRGWMLREVEACLKRLQTDHVDILYMHRDFNGMDLESRCVPSTSCCAPARSATGACPTSAAGASPKRCG